MGIYTGDSIVIAPSPTLADDEYYSMRECAHMAIWHLGVFGETNQPGELSLALPLFAVVTWLD